MNKYTLNVETDWDFTLEFKGELYSDNEITLLLSDVSELDQIKLQGPFGAPHEPEKRWEWDEAMEAIKANPEKGFSNQGGNRGVSWTVCKNELNSVGILSTNYNI